MRPLIFNFHTLKLQYILLRCAVNVIKLESQVKNGYLSLKQRTVIGKYIKLQPPKKNANFSTKKLQRKKG